jgi:membrane-associated phospholipid phosphatase
MADAVLGGMRVLAVVVVAACATTSPSATNRMPTPLDGLGSNVVDAFSGENLLYHGGAVAISGAMILSDGDHAAHVAFAHGVENSKWNETANLAGYVLPIVIPSTLWIGGLASRDRTLTGAGSAAIQAVVITLATTGALKLAIGRHYPVQEAALGDSDQAREVDPFQRLGAWPSGHTSSMISIAAALTAYAPEKWWIPLVGYPLGLAIGLGMMDRDSHWASDLLAGALIGHAIGSTVGRNFRRRVRGTAKDDRGLDIVPLTTGAAGAALRGRW